MVKRPAAARAWSDHSSAPVNWPLPSAMAKAQSSSSADSKEEKLKKFVNSIPEEKIYNPLRNFFKVNSGKSCHSCKAKLIKFDTNGSIKEKGSRDEFSITLEAFQKLQNEDGHSLLLLQNLTPEWVQALNASKG
jgi:hypothetical protein